MSKSNKGESINKNPISRRSFIEKCTILGVGSLLGGKAFPNIVTSKSLSTYPPRERIPNPFITQDGKPLLVVINGNDFESMLQKGLEVIGGLSKLISNNQNVLIKPNMNAIDIYPAISSASSIASLASKVVGHTSGNVTVFDVGYQSPSSVSEQMNLIEYLEGTGANFSFHDEHLNVRRSSWSSSKPNYEVYKEVYRAATIINFACLKRHWLGKITVGMKNNIGTITGVGGTGSRELFHSYSQDVSLAEIAEVAGLVNPELTIVDARKALIGNGPGTRMANARILKGLDKLILCGDIVAIDLYCNELMQSIDRLFTTDHSDPLVATFTRAQELGLGVSDLSEVEIIETSVTSVGDDKNSYPADIRLYQNHPNPFNPSTIITFKLPEKTKVTVKVYDVHGRVVRTLVDKQFEAGFHKIQWNGLDNLDMKVSSGMYLYSMKAGDFVDVKKGLLIK